MPVLLLKHSRDTKVASDRQIGCERKISEFPAIEECLVNIVVAIAKLQSILRRKMIGQPRLFSPAPPSNPAANQVAAIAIAGTVAPIPIKCSRAKMVRHIQIGGNAFKSQFRVVDFGDS